MTFLKGTGPSSEDCIKESIRQSSSCLESGGQSRKSQEGIKQEIHNEHQRLWLILVNGVTPISPLSRGMGMCLFSSKYFPECMPVICLKWWTKNFSSTSVSVQVFIIVQYADSEKLCITQILIVNYFFSKRQPCESVSIALRNSLPLKKNVFF